MANEITATEIIKGVGSILGGVLGAYLIYMVKTIGNRIKALETDLNDQKVINQSFYEYKLFKNKKDDELQEILKEIKLDIKGMKKDFFSELKAMTKSINEIKIDIAGLKS